MNTNQVSNVFDKIKLDREQKEKILNNLIEENHAIDTQPLQFHKKSFSHTKKFSVAVACCAIIISFCGVAYAGNYFFSDLIIPKMNSDKQDEKNTQSIKEYGSDYVSNNLEKMSAVGFAKSKETLALIEWENFLDSYDPDGKLLDKADTDEKAGVKSSVPESELYLYDCYTQEMSDKLHEIAKKYGLSLHQTNTQLYNQQEFIKGLGIGDFLKSASVYPDYREDNLGFYGHYYDDKSFSLDATSKIRKTMISYQICATKKGYLSTNSQFFEGKSEDYNITDYKTSSGQPVILALGTTSSFVIVDTDSYFLMFSITNGAKGNVKNTEGAITLEDLQAFVDQFDLSLLK